MKLLLLLVLLFPLDVNKPQKPEGKVTIQCPTKDDIQALADIIEVQDNSELDFIQMSHELAQLNNDDVNEIVLRHIRVQIIMQKNVLQKKEEYNKRVNSR